ncbi:hypothetical protein OUZ56_026064 [Daphnia magna]|uniref:Uncharacterized protein n=1 Tax=Daphnia magna TaxID=35525 RepID=A0ABQ9ZLN5_9CRUS|nr:hypothetical protein OUZ56_026064 [Daphnia magna]
MVAKLASNFRLSQSEKTSRSMKYPSFEGWVRIRERGGPYSTPVIWRRRAYPSDECHFLSSVALDSEGRRK